MRSLIAALAFTILPPPPALAQAAPQQRYALLIGASAYEGIKPDGKPRALNGPRNDVTLLHRTLIESGIPVSNITVLADTLERASYSEKVIADARPEHDRIITAFKALAAKARQGDQVMIYMSGHGSKHEEIEKPGGSNEDDGIDETFLPVDIGDWKKIGTPIENEIVDDKFGELIDPIVDKGVFVWFVVDACHSGTVVRSGDTGAVARSLSPQDLGAPPELRSTARITRSGGAAATPIPKPLFSSSKAARRGSFVAFYAALPDQEAKENLVPKGANADDQRIHGLMTYALVKALRSGRSATYAGLAQSVTASMWQWGGAASTPMFDGDLDREPMINAGKERAWRMTESDGGLMVKAGQLDDIGEGAVFAVRYVNAPAAEPPLFYIRVRSALLEQSAVEIIANDRNRPNRIADELDRRGLKQWLSNSRTDTIEATLIERVPSFVLSVARPSLAVGPDANTVSTAIKALSLTSPAEAPLAITWQSPGSSSDVRLELAGKRLWFIPEAEPVVRSGPNQTYSLPLASVNSTSLAAALRTIGKARNLTRLAATYGETHIARQMRTSVAIVKHTPKPDGSCDQFLPENSVPTAATDSNPGRFPGSGLIRIERCDRVYISLTNTGETPIDVTPLYIDSWSRTWRIPGYPGHQTDGLRVQPLQTRVISFQEEAESDGKLTVVGLARIVLVAIEGKPQQIPVSFRSLVADLPDGGQRRLRSEITGFAAVLDAAAFGNGTVRSGPEGSAEAGGIKVIGVETFATPAEYAAASNLN